MSFSFPQQVTGFGINSPQGQGKGKDDTRECYNCGVTGHIGRDCPVKGKGAGSAAGAAALQSGAMAQQPMFFPPGVGYQQFVGNGNWGRGGTPDNTRQKQ
jgi:hypothetical protein